MFLPFLAYTMFTKRCNRVGEQSQQDGCMEVMLLTPLAHAVISTNEISLCLRYLTIPLVFVTKGIPRIYNELCLLSDEIVVIT